MGMWSGVWTLTGIACLLVGVCLPARAADINNLPWHVRAMLECVRIDWTAERGAEWPRQVTLGTSRLPEVEPAVALVSIRGGTRPFPLPEVATPTADASALARQVPFPESVDVKQWQQQVSARRAALASVSDALQMVQEGVGVVTVDVPIPTEYWRLAAAIIKDANDGLERLKALPIGTKLLLTAHLVMQGRQEEAEELVDSIDLEAYLALPVEERTRISRFVNNAVRYEYENARPRAPERGLVLYELFVSFATERYGREYIHFWAGCCHHWLKEYGKAVPRFETALELMGSVTPASPHDGFGFETVVLLYLGDCLAHLEKHDEAIPLLLKVNVDERRRHFWRVRADNVLCWIAKKTGLPRGVAPSE